MYLRNIKLAGFKSFVDPTHITTAKNLMGIVGPNGCGKSNIIDAITWVMGESSARHLRGELLTDVIFNGSGNRVASGLASVELIFDNSEQRLGGAYAQYNELSVKRKINRNGESSFYINGGRCLRKDIKSIFLGTGLGTRSYAIIEQGMIGRLVEAKPEEIRSHIEEASGISKYRAKRLETENRIKHTKENINRLNDIQIDIQKQMKHLKKQASVAKRYKKIQEDLRLNRAELLAIHWRDLNNELTQKKSSLNDYQNKFDKNLAVIRSVDAQIENKRTELNDVNQSLNQSQLEFYQIDSKISNLEQQKKNIHERVEQMTGDKEKAEQSLQQSQHEYEHDTKDLKTLINQLDSLKPDFQTYQEKRNQADDQLKQAEKEIEIGQGAWDQFSQLEAESKKQKERYLARLEHLEDNRDTILDRYHELQNELENIINDQEEQQTIDDNKNILEEQEQLYTELKQAHHKLKDDIQQWRNQSRQLNEELNIARSKFQQDQGQLSSLTVLQQNHFSETQEQQQWLEVNQLNNNKRLSQLIQIDPAWSLALETVLGDHLYNICIENLEDVTKHIKDNQLDISFQQIKNIPSTQPRLNKQRLLDVITNDIKVPTLFHHIYIATDLASAQSMLAELQDHESVITQDGFWLGHGWLKINTAQKKKQGILSIEHDLKELNKHLTNSKQAIQVLEESLSSIENKIVASEKKISELQKNMTDQQDKINHIKNKIISHEMKVSQTATYSQRIQTELDDTTDKKHDNEKEIEALQLNLSNIEDTINQDTQKREQLIEQRKNNQSKLDQERDEWRSIEDQYHTTALQFESLNSRHQEMQKNIDRNTQQLDYLQKNINDINHNLRLVTEPLTQIKEDIQSENTNKINMEKELTKQRNQLQSVENEIREYGQKKQQQETELEKIREELDQLKIITHECQVRIQNIEAELKEQQFTIADITPQIADDAKAEDWQEKVDNLKNKIKQLGSAINLAAIDEYKQVEERKQYLDEQYEDLQKALQTLENAIRKIDQETRSLFKETFDKINTNIKNIYTELFPGGNAYLQLTEDDILHSGVEIIASPAGKKNRSINLLSGGEKALTAIAFVFSIFSLNPAPFCILDEVDAPLDDSNVLRFSRLVKSMSYDIQFIIITHNKITMELTDQLLGVTMNEAGVSRIVSVDINESAKYAMNA